MEIHSIGLDASEKDLLRHFYQMLHEALQQGLRLDYVECARVRRWQLATTVGTTEAEQAWKPAVAAGWHRKAQEQYGLFLTLPTPFL